MNLGVFGIGSILGLLISQADCSIEEIVKDGVSLEASLHPSNEKIFEKTALGTVAMTRNKEKTVFLATVTMSRNGNDASTTEIFVDLNTNPQSFKHDTELLNALDPNLVKYAQKLD